MLLSSSKSVVQVKEKVWEENPHNDLVEALNAEEIHSGRSKFDNAMATDVSLTKYEENALTISRI